MAQPTAYTPTADFSDDELNAVGGRSTVRTSALDAEFSALNTTLDQVLAVIALNQRDDGEVRDGRVKMHTLASDVRALLSLSGTTADNLRGDWVTATDYVPLDLVSESGNTYVCTTAHTSGAFATDLAADKWLIVSLGTAVAAGSVQFTPTATIAASTVQAAIEEADTEGRALSAAAQATANAAAVASHLADVSTAARGDALIGWGAICSIVDGVLTRHASLAAAVTAVGSTRCTVVVRDDITMAASATFPSTATLRIENRARITTTGYTITVNGSFECGRVQCFSGSGTVTFAAGAVAKVWPEWFGETESADDGVNVLNYIAPSKWPGIVNGTSTDDLATELQAALTAERHLFFPDGLYRTGTKLTPRVDARIRGASRRGVKLRATAAITILEYPINTFDAYLENIRFQGPAGYTGVAVASTAGALQGYWIRPHVRGCDFDYATSGFGINADCIYGHIESSSFGYESEVVAKPSVGSGSFTGIKSFVYPATTNYTNMNVLERCIFDSCGNTSSATAVALDLSGGNGWAIRDCDFSFGGVQIRTSNIQTLKFEGTNWFEGNVVTNAVVEFGACTTPVRLVGANWSNNTCDRLVQAPLDGTCRGIVWTENEISKNGASYCLYDTVSLARTLPANGSVTFYGNNVAGGNAGDKLVTATEFRGGAHSARFTAVVDTSGSGSLVSCSDPAVTVARNGAGDVTLSTPSMPLGTTAAKVVALVSLRHIGASSAGMSQSVTVATTSVRVRLQDTAGSGADGTFSISVMGS